MATLNPEVDSSKPVTYTDLDRRIHFATLRAVLNSELGFKREERAWVSGLPTRHTIGQIIGGLKLGFTAEENIKRDELTPREIVLLRATKLDSTEAISRATNSAVGLAIDAAKAIRSNDFTSADRSQAALNDLLVQQMAQYSDGRGDWQNDGKAVEVPRAFDIRYPLMEQPFDHRTYLEEPSMHQDEVSKHMINAHAAVVERIEVESKLRNVIGRNDGETDEWLGSLAVLLDGVMDFHIKWAGKLGHRIVISDLVGHANLVVDALRRRNVVDFKKARMAIDQFLDEQIIKNASTRNIQAGVETEEVTERSKDPLDESLNALLRREHSDFYSTKYSIIGPRRWI